MPFTLPSLIAHSNCKHTTKLEMDRDIQIELSREILKTGQIIEQFGDNE